MNACPSSDRLACLLAEQLEEAEQTSIEAHVESCSQCHRTLALLSEDSAQTSLAKRTGSESKVDGVSQEFLERVKERGGKPEDLSNNFRGSDSRDLTLSLTESLPCVPGYELLAELGRGGMGVVYKARHLGLNRLVALKMLLASRFVTADSRRRFQREAQAIARLHHVNIVQIYDVGETDAGPFFSLELVEAGSLTLRLDGTPWQPRAAAGLVERLASAIHYAHEQGIIHRDLKPGNILLQRAEVRGQISDVRSQDSKVGSKRTISSDVSPFTSDLCPLTSDLCPKIADFGLAKCVEDENAQTPDGAILGTPSYLAPEQVASTSQNVGPATDVYGLGAILYELLTGLRPFRAESAMATLLLVTHQEPTPPSRIGVQLPRDLETICLKCLQKSPEQRYGSAKLLADELSRFLAGEPIHARPPGPAERAVKWVKRNPTFALLVAGVLLALGIGGGGTLWFVLDRQAHKAAVERDRLSREARVEREVSRLIEETMSLYGRAQGAGRDLGLWADALAAAKRADAVAATGGAGPEVRTRVRAILAEIEQIEKNQRMLASLLDIQVSMGDELLGNGDQDFPEAEAKYARAFLDYGIANLDKLTPEEGAAALHPLGDAVRVEVAAALDNWGYVRIVLRMAKEDRHRLHSLSRLLDPDPLRNRIRDAIVKSDRPALLALAAEIVPATQPVQTVNLVAVCLSWSAPVRTYVDEIKFLQAAQAAHPGDFQINHNLAFSLMWADRGEEAIPYATAAVALRPKSATAWQSLADAFNKTERDDEAIAAHRRVVALAPKVVPHLEAIGKILERQGKPDEAVLAYREALQRAPKYYPRYSKLVPTWQRLGMIDEVVAAYRKVIELYPKHVNTRQGLCTLLLRTSRWAEFIAETERLIPLDPTHAASHYFYLGVASRNLGKYDAALAAFRGCLESDAKYTRATTYLESTHRLMALEKRLPAILRGESASIQDQLDLANSLQHDKKRFADAAALFTRVFAAETIQAEEIARNYRYDAACAAILAADTEIGADKLDTTEQILLRKQALDWLRSDLTEGLRRVEKDPTAAVQFHDNLERWQRDAALAGVRDDKELAKLPAESAAWKKLWGDVDRFAKEARASYAQTDYYGHLGARHLEKIYPLKLVVGNLYAIEMESPEFNTYLRLEDGQGQVVAENDDISKGNQNSHIVFNPAAAGAFRIVATSFKQRGAGAYTIRVREFATKQSLRGLHAP